MFQRRLKAPASFPVAHYHCLSQVVNRDFIFGRQERELFVRLLREYQRFCGVRVLVAPAATRWTLQVPGIDPFVLDIAIYSLVYPFLIALALFDRRNWGRVHPATWTSLVLVLPLHVSGAWIARSKWWNAVAPGLVGQP